MVVVVVVMMMMIWRCITSVKGRRWLLVRGGRQSPRDGSQLQPRLICLLQQLE